MPTPRQPRQPKPAAALIAPAPGDDAYIPIVGIGASAGGLEALEQFLSNVPPASGIVFVVIQHQDPTYKGMLVELLQRATAMKVVQIADRTKVERNHVYVIPPNRDLSILHGVLHLLEPAAPRGLRLPINSFLRSLAADQKERSIGVILSGMGSDGTLGLRAIKEQAGAVFVQAPDSAKFDSMPQSAIATGLADVVAPADELAAKIVAYLQHVPLLVRPYEPDLEFTDQSALEKVVLILRAQTSHDFSLYKKSTIYRRIERRMGLHQLPKIADYVRYLRENPQEADLLFKELLIGVTSFFRDPAVWEELGTQFMPALLSAHADGGNLRVWVPGCSTGEEAYSLAIVFCEVLERLKPGVHYSLQVFATDLDKEAIVKARTGFYPANIAADVSEARLKRFFVREERGYWVSKEIRDMVIFAPQNLVMDPPFTRLDLLSCRNLLIYMEAELQKKILPLFHYSLNPGGILLLGSAETVGHATNLFEPSPGEGRFYRRREVLPGPDTAEFPTVFGERRATAPAGSPAPTEATAEPSLQVLTESLLLQHFAPAAVLTTENGDIVYISGRTGKYLEPAAGRANLNIFAMAREGLDDVLSEAFPRALRQSTPIVVNAVSVGSNGGTAVVDVTVQSLDEPAPLRAKVLIVFAETAALAPATPGKPARATAPGARLKAATEELERSRLDLKAVRVGMQTSQEELKSTNEELQSTNEELQSTNEELTTSKEEMQSMNEELHTVNHELVGKVDELSRASDDMKNLLNSTDIATLFLDDQLRVRRFTTQAAGIIRLIAGDVGRPITDLVTTLDYPGLADDVKEVLRTLVFHEVEVAATDGRWHRVRIMPYQTQDNRIDGVVVTFVDISESKELEATLREALSVLQGRFTVQGAELDHARVLEDVLQKAQAVLKVRLGEQAISAGQAVPDDRSGLGKRP